VEATSTNGDLFVVPVSGGEPENELRPQPGFDRESRVFAGWEIQLRITAQLTAGYEADRWRVMLYDPRRQGKAENLTETVVRPERSESGRGQRIGAKIILISNAENETPGPEFRRWPPKLGAVYRRKLIDGYNGAVSMRRRMERRWRFTRTSLTMPGGSVLRAASDGTGLKQVTHQNDAALAKIEMNAPERSFWFEGAESETRVHAMLIKARRNSMQRRNNPLAGAAAWRAANDVGRFVGLPVECAGIFGGLDT